MNPVRLLLLLSLWLPGPARAHEAFGEYVWHRVRFGLNPRHLDVTVELTFFEDWSARERRRMDADGDGRIQRAELDAYARGLESVVARKVALLVGGQRVALITLHAPEVDLLGRETVERGHHQLTLRFFAPIPRGLAPGAAIVVEDALWPEARCLAEGAGVAGTRGALVAGDVGERAFPARADEPLRFAARWVGPPAGEFRHP